MKKNLFSLLLVVFIVLAFSEPGFADDFNDVGGNITFSIKSLPGLLAALAYLSGLIVAVTAIFKTVDHVNNPTQTPISVPVIRFFLASGLFGLPIIAEAVSTTINGGSATDFDPQTEAYTIFNDLLGGVSTYMSFGTNVNSVMENMVDSVEFLPGFVSAIGYLLGLVIMVSALYKTRDHVEDPNRVPLKDAVIRYLTAGALFALPTIYDAMYDAISAGGLGLGGTLYSLLSTLSFVYSSESHSADCMITLATPLANSTVGDVICNSFINTSSFPVFLNAIAYLLGLVLGVWGILKIRDHVIEPTRVALSEGVTRLVAGGAFFSLPYLVSVFKATFLDVGIVSTTTVTTNSTFLYSSIVNGTTSCSTTNSLDEAMGCFMNDILGPSHIVLNFFSFVAGMIFIMIGISRLIKSSQEGPRGPGGIGTFGTFVVGGMLLSATTILRAFSTSLFTQPVTYTYATLQYTGGMSATETQAAYNVIAAVLQFLIVIGMISFVRGMFIMRDVAEGKGNASTMAGMTHLIGGALAVNMGPLLNAIQETLGITAIGVSFGA